MASTDRAEAERLGELAAECVPLAAELACLVRDEGRAAIARFLRPLGGDRIPERARALLVVLAAMVDIDRSPEDLLAWVDFGPSARLPFDPSVPPGGRPAGSGCGTYAAYARHKARNEPVDPACQDAARAYWAGRKRAQRAAARADRAVGGLTLVEFGDAEAPFCAPVEWHREAADVDLLELVAGAASHAA